MRPLPTYMTTHMKDRGYRACQLVDITNVTTGVHYRFTDWSANVVFSGNTYSHRSFSAGTAVTDAKSRQAVQIGFNNQDKFFTPLAFAYTWRDWPATLYEAWFDASNVLQAVIIKVIGTAQGLLIEEEGGVARASTAIAFGANIDQSTGPRVVYGVNCPHLFKGVDGHCGYIGIATDCDRTFTTCAQLGNEARFGGHRFALSPGQIIYFGPGVTQLDPRFFQAEVV